MGTTMKETDATDDDSGSPDRNCRDQGWFRVAFVHSPIGMALLDLDGRFEEVNEPFCRVVARPRAELVGTDIEESSHPADADRHAALRERLRTTPGGEPTFEAEHRFVRGDGQIAWTRTTCSLLRSGDGSPWRYVCQVVDMSEHKAAEATSYRAQELRQRYEKEMARSNADLALFATVAAHDLKSPLQVIAGFGGLLEQTHGDVLDERGKEFLAFILKSATRMNVLIDDLLAYAQVGADRRPNVSVPLDRVVGDVTAALGAEIVASGGSVEADPLPVVSGDPTLFVPLLQNLVANGLKFVAQGTLPRIRVSASRMVNAWCVDVVDNGIGIDAQHRSHIMGMFQRLHRDAYEGTGIGLAICKRIVEQRGGSIWVEENPGGGSRFRFTVPDEPLALGLDTGPDDDFAAIADHADLPDLGRAAGHPTGRTRPLEAAAAPGPAAVDPGSEGLDVLLVEDDDAHARLVVETLATGPEGAYRVRRARDLAGARTELHRHRTDCILLDLFLPDGQGLESLAELTIIAPLVPIVILTSIANQQLGLRAVHEGAQDFLVKGTVDGARLSLSLRHAIERKALEARFADQALHDPLTGVANKTLLLDRLRLELAHNGRTGTGVAVFYLDIDGFRGINERWGHEAGDEVLVRVARRLSQMVRSRDTVGRVGGDEFVVVCGGVRTEGDLEQMRARIDEAVGRSLLLGGGTELVTASIGMAVGRDPAETPQAIIRRADEALFQAKRDRLGESGGSGGLTSPTG
jgi:diguanylate cyclase (GGDEF)-like protein/PAS domain S-box-containing protein